MVVQFNDADIFIYFSVQWQSAVTYKMKDRRDSNIPIWGHSQVDRSRHSTEGWTRATTWASVHELATHQVDVMLSEYGCHLVLFVCRSLRDATLISVVEDQLPSLSADITITIWYQ